MCAPLKTLFSEKIGPEIRVTRGCVISCRGVCYFVPGDVLSRPRGCAISSQGVCYLVAGGVLSRPRGCVISSQGRVISSQGVCYLAPYHAYGCWIPGRYFACGNLRNYVPLYIAGWRLCGYYSSIKIGVCVFIDKMNSSQLAGVPSQPTY